MTEETRELTHDDDDCAIWQVTSAAGERWEVKVGALKLQKFDTELEAIDFMRLWAGEAAHDRPPEGWAFKRRLST